MLANVIDCECGVMDYN